MLQHLFPKRISTNTHWLVLVFVHLFSTALATGIKHPHTEGGSNIRFTENKNQWESIILYRAELDGGVLFLEKNCFTYSFYDKEAFRAGHDNFHKENQAIEHNAPHETTLESYNAIRAHAFRTTFVNASEQAIAQRTDQHSLEHH